MTKMPPRGKPELKTAQVQGYADVHITRVTYLRSLPVSTHKLIEIIAGLSLRGNGHGKILSPVITFRRLAADEMPAVKI